jgi:aryl carrier-like protein
VKESLTTAQINPEMSIIDDLGLDSLDLTELAARIRADIGAIDFLPWLAQVPAGGGTVASLAEFVAAAQPERRGEGWPY